MEKKEIITITELLKRLEDAQSKNKKYDLSKHLKRIYVPHLEKIKAMETVVNRCSYNEINGKQVYCRHTPTLYFTLQARTLQLYFDLEFENVIDDYDALAAAGVLEPLMSLIPETERTELKTMMLMIRDDIEFNTREIVPFLETKLEAFGIGANSLFDALNSPEIKEKIAELTKE